MRLAEVVPGIGKLDPCDLPLVNCADLVDFRPFLVEQAEYLAGMISLGLVPFVDIVVAVRDTIGAAIQGEWGWAIFEVVAGAAGFVVPVAGDIPGVVKDAVKWAKWATKTDELVYWMAKASDAAPASGRMAAAAAGTNAFGTLFAPVLRTIKTSTYNTLSKELGDDQIMRLARGGINHLDDVARLINDSSVEVVSTGGRWFDETATRGQWGKEAENQVRAQTGGTSKRMNTVVPGGKFRVLDDWTDNGILSLANEVKTGDGRLDRRLRLQIEKDAYLLSNNVVDSYVWNFFPSGRSNRVGPDEELLKLLKQKGIKVKVWLP